MLRATKQWDVRCPQALTNMYPTRTGYYYKIDREQARRIISVLSEAYDLPAGCIIVSDDKPNSGFNGTCWFLPKHRSQIDIHGRGHMKTTFHEFYHALDHATSGKYNSSDRQGGDTSLAWQFADRLFEVFRNQRPNSSKVTIMTTKKNRKAHTNTKRQQHSDAITDSTVVRFVKARSKSGSRTKLLELVPKTGVTVSKLATLAKRAQVKVADVRGAVGFLRTHGYLRAA